MTLPPGWIRKQELLLQVKLQQELDKHDRWWRRIPRKILAAIREPM